MTALQGFESRSLAASASVPLSGTFSPTPYTSAASAIGATVDYGWYTILSLPGIMVASAHLGITASGTCAYIGDFPTLPAGFKYSDANSISVNMAGVLRFHNSGSGYTVEHLSHGWATYPGVVFLGNGTTTLGIASSDDLSFFVTLSVVAV